MASSSRALAALCALVLCAAALLGVASAQSCPSVSITFADLPAECANPSTSKEVLCGECASAGVKKIAKQLGSGSCMALARCQASITQSLNSSGALSYVHRLTQICDVNKLANEISSDIDCTGPGKPSPSTVAMLLRGRS